MTEPRIAAVIVRWKNGLEVEACLRSLLSSEPLAPSEIVLVDAGSGDGGARQLVQAFPEIQVEALPKNPGFAGAANHGVSATTADYIFLLNPDTEVVGEALKTLSDKLARYPDLAGAVPLLENPDGSSQHRWQLREFPTVRDLSLGRPGRPQFNRRPQDPTAVCQPAAAAWLIRRKVWNSLGGLDETFFPAWWEDVDFSTRLREKLKDPSFAWNQGWRAVPHARVRHLGGSSVGALGKRAFFEAFYRNLLTYAKRHHAPHLSVIRSRLRRNLMIRAVLRPTRFWDYRSVWRVLDDARPSPED